MKKKHIVRLIALVMAALLIFGLGGCGSKKSNTIAEPEEITVEYLSGEYAEQLIRDGGECTSGTITIEENEDASYSLTVDGMVIVESDITDEGYYIADNNLSSTVPLSSDARVTYINDKDAGPEIIELEEFVQLVQETVDPLEAGKEKLYDVYTIGGNVLMVLAKEMPVIE